MTDVPMIRMVSVDKHFGELHVLRDIHLEVTTGQVVVVIGPSGSGKSTLCRTINRLEPIDSGIIEVDGKRLEVVVPAGLGGSNGGGGAASPTRKPARRGGGASGAKATSGNALTSPMQGTIVKVAVADGDVVEAGDLVVVLEAMKMEQPLVAHRAGTVSGLVAEVGATVTSGSTLCEIVDA